MFPGDHSREPEKDRKWKKMVDRQQKKPMTWGEKLTRENRGLREKIGTLKTEMTALQRDLRNTWQLMEALPGLVILLEKGRIVFANEAVCEALGYEKRELSGMRLTDLVHPDSKIFLDNFSGKISSVNRKDDPDEAIFLKKDGGSLFCAVGLRAIRRNRKKAFLVNMLEMERIKAKEKRDCTALNMETMKRLITNFDKQMKNLMPPFEMSGEGLEIGQTGDKNQKIPFQKLEHLRKTLSSMERELSLIARPPYDPSEMGPLNLQEIIREAEVACRNRISGQSGQEEAGVGLKKYLRTVSSVWGCKGEMREVFVSIIQNAMEAAGPFGEIHVTSEEDSGFAFVYVQDSGPGIRKDVADNVYEPFFTAKKLPHRGLGLSMAHAVVERHGGKLSLISREDQGTTVAVRLPIVEKGLTKKVGGRRNRIRDRSVLLVSSENRLADLLRLLFADRGGRVTVASGEKEAVRELRRDIYDLLIMSYDTGRDAMESRLRRIKKLLPDLAIVLVYTGKQIGERPFWEGLGVAFIEGRPLNMDVFFQLLSEILEKKGAR